VLRLVIVRNCECADHIQLDARTRVLLHSRWLHSRPLRQWRQTTTATTMLALSLTPADESLPTDCHTSYSTATFLTPFFHDPVNCSIEWINTTNIEHRPRKLRHGHHFVLQVVGETLRRSILFYTTYILMGDTNFYLPPRKWNHPTIHFYLPFRGILWPVDSEEKEEAKGQRIPRNGR